MVKISARLGQDRPRGPSAPPSQGPISGALSRGAGPHLGDPHRRDILRLLGEGGEAGRPVRDIAAALPISRPAVSRHLRLLKEAGLVAERAQGTSRIYYLRDEGLHAVQAYLEQVWGDAAQRFRFLAENTGK